MIILSKRLKNEQKPIKMFIVCILFLLAVYRLVLVVNSWDAFLGGIGSGEEACPHTTETVFCSGLINPSALVFILFYFIFSLICIFPELEELKGEVFC